MVKIFLNGCCGRMGKAIAALCYNNPDYKIVAGGDIIESVIMISRYIQALTSAQKTSM